MTLPVINARLLSLFYIFPSMQERQTVEAWIKRLGQLNPQELIISEIENLSRLLPPLAERNGFSPEYIKELLLKQIILAVISLQQPLSKIVDWGTFYEISSSRIDAILKSTVDELTQAGVIVAAALTPEQSPVQSSSVAHSQVPQLPVAQSQEVANAYLHPQPNPGIEVYEEILTNPDRIGERLEEAFQYRLQGVKFESSCDRGMIHYRLLFQKPVSIQFSLIKPCIQDVLSHAGLDPSLEVTIEFKERDRFILHIPKLRSEWEEAKFTLPRNWTPAPWDPFQLPFMADVEGKGRMIDLSSGALMIGAPNTGKSNALRTIIAGATQLYSPASLPILQILAAFDLKDGLTFSSLSDCPWMRGAVVASDDFDPQAKTKEVFGDILEPEIKRRAALFKEAHVDKIQDFNQKHPQDALFWSPIFIDEIMDRVKVLGEKNAEKLDAAILRWRCYGFPVIATSWYADQKMSLPPAIRSAFGSAAVFRTSEQAAKMVFDDSTWSSQASKLVGGGDCILKSGHEFIRGRVFNTPSDMFYALLHQSEAAKRVRNVLEKASAPEFGYLSYSDKSQAEKVLEELTR
jgi:hypothetical protein